MSPDPDSAFGIDTVADETNLTSTPPDLPKGPLGSLLESGIPRQAAQDCEFKRQASGSSATRLRNLTQLRFVLVLVVEPMQGRIGIEGDAMTEVDPRVRNSRGSVKGRQQPLSKIHSES